MNSTDDLILSAFLREESFSLQYLSVVDEVMFSEYPHKVCLNSFLSYAKTYYTLPSLEELNTEIHRYCQRYGIDTTIESIVLALSSKCMSMTYNISYVRDIFVKFATKNKVTSAILESAQLLKTKGDQLEEKDYDHIQELLTESMSISKSNSEGLLFSDVADDPTKYIKENNRYDPESVVKTGIRSFDHAHIAGGPIPGEMYVVTAPPGKGKSTLLVNIGVSALLQGRDVIHIFVGDNKEADGVLRYCSRMTQISMSQIMLNTSTYLPTWNLIKSKFKLGELLLKAYSIGEPSVQDIRSFITKNKIERSIKPKVLIVDYIDNCRRDSNKSSYDDLGDMYASLKSIAEDLDLIVWTASQPKLEFWDAGQDQVVGLSALAESSKKQHHVDGMITMKKLDDTAYQLYVPKLRRGVSDLTIDLRIEWDKMLVIESIPTRMANQRGQTIPESPYANPATSTT